MVISRASLVLCSLVGVAACLVRAAPAPASAFIEKHCANCHNDADKEGDLDLTALSFVPGDLANFQRWVLVHDRLTAGDMPPK